MKNLPAACTGNWGCGAFGGNKQLKGKFGVWNLVVFALKSYYNRASHLKFKCLHFLQTFLGKNEFTPFTCLSKLLE